MTDIIVTTPHLSQVQSGAYERACLASECARPDLRQDILDIMMDDLEAYADAVGGLFYPLDTSTGLDLPNAYSPR